MYDAMNEPHEFVGESREDAIARACKFFGTTLEALSISEFRPGEIYGLGGRFAVVAAPRNRTPVARGGGDREERGDRGGRGERGDRGDRDRGRGRGRGDRGDRGDRGGDRPRRGMERGGEGQAARGAEAFDERPRREEAPQAPSEPSIGTPRGSLGEIGRYLLGVIERMELGPFEIGESAEAELLVIDVKGAAAGALVGGDGRPVDALQLLANQAGSRGEAEGPRIVLEVEGDAQSRETLLARLAERVARRARETGRAVALDPMNGKDRRLIHIALRDEGDIATMSIGEGRYRQVVVVPEGAPEYEQARREAAAAADRHDG
jgi:spoIIIJ-associated protein